MEGEEGEEVPEGLEELYEEITVEVESRKLFYEMVGKPDGSGFSD